VSPPKQSRPVGGAAESFGWTAEHEANTTPRQTPAGAYCAVCGQPRLPAWPPWTAPDPHDAAWAIAYLVAGVWDAPHRGGVVPTRERTLDALDELAAAHGDGVLRRACKLAAAQPLPAGVDRAGHRACVELGRFMDQEAAA